MGEIFLYIGLSIKFWYFITIYEYNSRFDSLILIIERNQDMMKENTILITMTVGWAAISWTVE